MAEFIDIIAQLKFDVQGDGTLKDVNVSLDKATAEAKQLDAQIDGIKRSIKETDNQAAKGVLQKELKKVNAEAKQLKANTQGVQTNVKSLGGTFSSIGSLAAGAFASFSILQLGQEVINATSQFQKFEAVLTNLTGSNEEAKQLIATFSQFAAETPFQVEEVVGAYVKLRNTGITPNIDAMRKLGDVASASGKDLNQLVEALIDAQVGENERLKEFGIRAQKVGEITKFTFRGVTTEVQNTSQAINDYLVSLGTLEGVQGSNAAIAATMAGQISNLKDSFVLFAKEIGTTLTPAFNVLIGLLSDTAKGLGIIFKSLNKSNEVWQEARVIFGELPKTFAENKGFDFVIQSLKDLETAIGYGGKGTLARVKALQAEINQAFSEGIITQDVLFRLSAKIQQAVTDAQALEKKQGAAKPAAAKTVSDADEKAAEQRAKAIADITDDLIKAIADQEDAIRDAQIKSREESLQTIKELNELEKQQALRAVDDREKAISEKLKGNIPASIKTQLGALRTAITRKFDLDLEQDLNEFKQKQQQAIIEFENERLKEKAKRQAEEAERLAAQRAQFFATISQINDEQIAAIDIAENEALTAAQTAYNKGLIDKERFEQLKTDITKTQGKQRIQLLINELEVERLALQAVTGDGSADAKRKIDEINVSISELNLQLAKLNETTAETGKTANDKLFDTFKAGYNEVLSLVQQVNAAIVANETEKINKLIALQQQRVDEANRIADEGNAEALEREQARLETLLQQREDAAQRQQRLSLILQASNFALAASEAILMITKEGVKSPLLIPLAGAALAAGIGFVLSLVNSTKGSVQAFKEGTPYVTGSDGIDKVPAMLTKGERVVTVGDNQRYGAIYDYLNTHQPDPKRVLNMIKTPNYAGLQLSYDRNRQFEREQTLSRALLEKMTFVNGNLEILVNETVKGNKKAGKVKVVNVTELADAVNNSTLRWKI